ncbi:MAG TPA: ATP-binding protein [Terriglobales bacterium]
MIDEIKARLREINVFSDLPDEQLTWLAERAQDYRFAPGEVMVQEGSPADAMIVYLEGETQGRRESASGRDVPVFNNRAPMVTGMLPFSRMTTFPLTVRAATPVRVLRFPTTIFPEMLQRMPELGPRLVGLMSDRIREVTRVEQQRDKLAALGKLSAGLAHELNNPASATKRAASRLRESTSALRQANREPDALALTPQQRRAVDEFESKLLSSSPVGERSALAQSELEEQICDFLQGYGVKDAWQFASVLAEKNVQLNSLKEFAAQLNPQALKPALTRITAWLEIESLIREVENSSTRISELVRAIKAYSFMDQSPVQDVDIKQGIEDTLTILNHKLKKKAIEIKREFASTPLLVNSYGSELNQVWTNLLDNAIDALDGSGHGQITVRTLRQNDSVIVEIADNGPGIPADIQARIFEPFFTTKNIGEGTGLGLDTVYRIIRKHHGNVSFSSAPGDTRFKVELPIPKSS